MKVSNSAPAKRLDRHPLGRRKLAPMIEVIESRLLMTGGLATGFLTGSVLLDGSCTPVPCATVQLFQASDATRPVCTQTTGANGQYLFTGLKPGDYLLKEVAPAGYTASGAKALSQLNPATAVGYDTIKVTVVDPAKVFVNYNGIVPSSYSVVNDVVKGQAQVNSVGPQSDTLGTSAGATDLNSGFQTFCVNDQQSLSFAGGERYQVTPRPITELTNGSGTVSADHAGRIAYLFNHYGNSSLSNVQGAGLQLAIWELVYDNGNTPDFAAGAFQTTGLNLSVNGETLSQVIAQAKGYFGESACHSETAVFLDASAFTCSTQGIQSVLATESLNFCVHKTDTGCHTGPVCDDHGHSVCDTGRHGDDHGGSVCDTGGHDGKGCDDHGGKGGKGCDDHGDHGVSVCGGDHDWTVSIHCGGNDKGDKGCDDKGHGRSVCDTGSHDDKGCDDKSRGHSVCDTGDHGGKGDDGHGRSVCDTSGRDDKGGSSGRSCRS